MRDTVMTERELALLSAKENLASLDRRPGYAEAMRQPRVGWTATVVCTVIAVGFAALTYASWQHIDATWLRWVVVLVFGTFAGLGALAAIGSSPSVDRPLYWGVAIIDKHRDDDKPALTVLTMEGVERRVPVSADLYGALRVGDVGVAVVGKDEPHEIAKFTRL